MSKKFFGQKIICQKTFDEESKSPKIFLVKNIWPNKILATKFWGQKNFWVKKIIRQKFLAQKFLGHKIFGLKKLYV